MNIKQAKQIPIEIILKSMGLNIEKESGSDTWFKSPFSPTEKNASFHVNKQNGYWYCFSSAIGGRNGIDLVIKLKCCTVSEALNFLEGLDSFSFQKQIEGTYEAKKENNSNSVVKIEYVQHIALKQYLASRGITKAQIIRSVKELHYKINEKQYFAIGFKNNSDGWELRSKYTKICIGKKDITLIKNQCRSVKIFEGFFDYLSLLQISEVNNINHYDYLILNSAALIVKNMGVLNQYEKIELYLDHDITGDKYTNFIRETFPNAIDCRTIFKDYKDVNEWILSI
ncbi:toprim domain-containing protein [Flavobacterium frigidarium]|uniref:toprim domain-containing protein n=1 Tax=Flavobacterium frigidarium TaxID=99286 RepID=UPI000429C616|nr:toprim domain-containing protein [Flavobacterium frigidarium]